jgi:fatty-acyl-CoA synthase
MSTPDHMYLQQPVVASEAKLRTPLQGLSHVRGRTDTPLSEQTITQWLDDTAQRWLHRTACVFVEQGVRGTWAQLRNSEDQLAAGLLKLGFTKGERIGIWSPNRAEWVLA